MQWMVGVLATVAASQAVAAVPEPPAPVHVMVVGTYHFGNPGLDLNNVKADDVLKPARQAELEAIAVALEQFRPTKIMVERVAPAADLHDPRYSTFTPAMLSSQRDERVQIAYRLAARLGHRIVYAIDEQSGPGKPDYFPFGKVAEFAAAHGQESSLKRLMDDGAAITGRIDAMQAKSSVADILEYLNGPGSAPSSIGPYYATLDIGDATSQPGADLNAMWYLRNAKIFANLQRAAAPGDRILVIYGSGHNYWLRHFANETPGYANIDPTPYLKQAAKAPR